MAYVYAWDDLIPVIDPRAAVHPQATLIGDVIIGPDCYVGPGAVLRGDFGRIAMAAGSNIQDNCVAHSYPDADVVVQEDGHVGHGAILHGCVVGRNALIGMNSVVMDGASVGENSIVGAMAFVKSGMQIPAGSLVLGAPARVVRVLTEEELAWKRRGTEVYQQLAREAFHKMRAVEPLSVVEADRPRHRGVHHRPLSSAPVKTPCPPAPK